jgi:AcrR family transcriptional regulator
MGASSTARIDEIHRAALELFTRKGYEATTMTDIGNWVGIRGPSLYKHVTSKQELLVEIVAGSIKALFTEHDCAIAGTDDPTERLRRAVEAHVRYHARHRLEAFVGNREIRSLEDPHRTRILAQRADYEARFRKLITDGMAVGKFQVTSPWLVSYAILDLGIGLAAWFREDSELSENEVTWQYVDFTLRLVGAG